MDVSMAILTADSNFPEAPYFLFFMTFITWNRKVCPFKWECTFIVLLHSIGKKIKTIYIVTLRAVRINTVLYKLTFMIINMTAGAPFKL